jgi:hypothetical protein
MMEARDANAMITASTRQITRNNWPLFFDSTVFTSEAIFPCFVGYVNKS